MQSASTPIASKYYSLALKNSFLTYKQFPLFTKAFALYLSYVIAISAYFSAYL